MVQEYHCMNNGFVSAENIGGSDEAAILCTTDSGNCCSDGVSEQQWLFPNGTRVPPRDLERGWTLWTIYSYGTGDSVIRLHRQPDSDGQVRGLFRCQN
jgi:hypothetical protein